MRFSWAGFPEKVPLSFRYPVVERTCCASSKMNELMLGEVSFSFLSAHKDWPKQTITEPKCQSSKLNLALRAVLLYMLLAAVVVE